MRRFVTRMILATGCYALLTTTAVVAQTTQPATQPKLTLKNTIFSSTNSTQPALSKGLTASAPSFPTTGIPFNPTTGTAANSTTVANGIGMTTSTGLADFQRQWAEIILLSNHIATLLGVQFNSPIEEAFFVLSVAKLYFESQQTQNSRSQVLSNGTGFSGSNRGSLNSGTGSSTTVSPTATTPTKSGKLTITNPILSSTPKK